jgi:hypothetical protein
LNISNSGALIRVRQGKALGFKALKLIGLLNGTMMGMGKVFLVRVVVGAWCCTLLLLRFLVFYFLCNKVFHLCQKINKIG